MRYLAGLPRQQTHLPRAAIRAWLPAYPALHSFILGYQVHCLLDEIDLARVVGRAFPFNLLRALLLLGVRAGRGRLFPHTIPRSESCWSALRRRSVAREPSSQVSISSTSSHSR